MIPSSLYCHTCGAANTTTNGVCFACKQPLELVPSETSVWLQGRYRLLTQVGKGGFGAVYRAEDTQEQDAIVAVKQINLRGLTPQETIEATDAFNREVALLSDLAHPNLPRIHDNFTDPEHWYLVMDFIEGQTLETYLEGKGTNYTAPLGEVLTLGMQLCAVLDYLHTREPAIIFRDLKPANIMRTPANKLYLIDFGIARRFKPGKLKDTIPFGSPGYAAPEQYGKAQTTPRADIYSLGVLLHTLLTGDDPIDNPFHFAPLRSYGLTGIASLERLIFRMVELDVNNRPETTREVQDELQRITNLQTSSRVWSPPTGLSPGTSGGAGHQQVSVAGAGQQLYMSPIQRTKLARRNFLVGSAALAGLTLIGVGGITNILTSLQSYQMSKDASFLPSTAPFFQAQQYRYDVHTKTVRSVAWSVKNQLVASTGDDGTIQMWPVQQAIQPKPSHPSHVLATNSPVATLAWGNAENANILAFAEGQDIQLWDYTHKTRTSFRAKVDPRLGNVSVHVTTLAWSPDGRYIALPTRAGLQIYNTNTKTIDTHLVDSRFFSRHDGITSIAWSPDRKLLAAGTTKEETLVWNVASGQLDTKLTFATGNRVAWSLDGKWFAYINNSSIFVKSLFSQSARAAFVIANTLITTLVWSPLGNYLAFAGAPSDQNVQVCMPFTRDRTADLILDDKMPVYSTHIETMGNDIYALAWSYDRATGKEYLIAGADTIHILEVDASFIEK